MLLRSYLQLPESKAKPVKAKIYSRIIEFMDVCHIPFMRNSLNLAITASLITVYPILIANASDNIHESEWICAPATNGKGWECTPAPKKEIIIKKHQLTSPDTSTTTAEPVNSDNDNIESPKDNIESPKDNGVVTTPPSNPSSIKNTLDWVPLSKLTSAHRSKLPTYACGAYIEPDRPGIDFQGNVRSQPIIVDADNSDYDKDSTISLDGNIRIQQANQQIEGESAAYYKLKEQVVLDGNIRFRAPGILITGNKAEIRIDNSYASIENASFVLHKRRLRGKAANITRHEDSTMSLTEASFTSCPPENTGWLLSAKTIKLDHDAGTGSARNAMVKIHNIPILYTPYLSFPIDDRRKSGFLFPSLGYNSINGAEITTPYYLNLDPQFDTTITPRILSKRGSMLEVENRYLTNSSKGELGIAGIVGKDQLKSENPYYNKERWLVNWRHKTNLTPQWNVGIDYSDASDKGYIDDFNSKLNLSSVSPLNQKAYTNYIGGDINHDWQFNINAYKYKNMSRTSDDPYNKLPQIKLMGKLFASDNIIISYAADYTKFSRADNWQFHSEQLDPNFDPAYKVNSSTYNQGYGIKRAEGERIYLETGTSFPIHWRYAFLTPEIKIRHTRYNISNIDRNEVVNNLNNAYIGISADDIYSTRIDTTVPTISIDSGLYFDRNISFGSTQYTHTLEPRMKYLYSPHVKDQEMNPVFDTSEMDFNYNSMWRDNRFSGYDRLPDANQIILGLESKMLDDNGAEKLRFGIGQIVYLQDRKVYISPTIGSQTSDIPIIDPEDSRKKIIDSLDESTSPLTAELVYNFNSSMSLNQEITWNNSRSRIDKYSINFRHHNKGYKVINIGYHYRDQIDRYVKDRDGYLLNPQEKTSNNLSQTDISAAWPVSKKWLALARWQYDITNKRDLEVLSGFEFNSCCYQVRFIWRSWIENHDANIDHPNTKSGVFLQISLLGLGDLSSGQVTRYLTGINGYNTEREN